MAQDNVLRSSQTAQDVMNEPEGGGGLPYSISPMNKDLDPNMSTEPSAPPMLDDEPDPNANADGQEHWYPQLQPKVVPQPGAQPGASDPNAINIVEDHFEDAPADDVPQPVEDDEKKQAVPHHEQQISEAYEMCEGIASMNDLEVISLQPEGKAVAPSESQVKSRSFTPKSQKIDVAAICKQLNGSIGLFKSKQKRIAAFTEMVISTNRAQRQEIRKYYNKKYQNPLLRVIQKNFSGALREILVYLTMSEHEFVTQWIEVALKKKDVNLLTLIICTQNNETLNAVRGRFDQQNRKSMVDNIDGLTSNLFHKRNINKFLLGLIETKRANESPDVDLKLVNNDVDQLIKASRSKRQLNKETYISIFTQRSLEHLYFVSVRFEEKMDHKTTLIDTVRAVWKESSETAYAVKVLLYFATRRHELFANCLGQAVHEPGPNFVMFLRVIVERAEVDLGNVIELYGEKALHGFVDRNIRKKEPDAARIIDALCGFNQ